MSSTMRWEPAPAVHGQQLSSTFKLLVSQRWFGHDGSLGSGEIILDQQDVAFLEGVIWASSSTEVREDARTLVDRINEHGAVRVWVE